MIVLHRKIRFYSYTDFNSLLLLCLCMILKRKIYDQKATHNQIVIVFCPVDKVKGLEKITMVIL